MFLKSRLSYHILIFFSLWSLISSSTCIFPPGWWPVPHHMRHSKLRCSRGPHENPCWLVDTIFFFFPFTMNRNCFLPCHFGQVLSDRGYDGATADLWSCGVVLFVLLAGYLPFDDPNLLTLYKKVSITPILEWPCLFSPLPRSFDVLTWCRYPQLSSRALHGCPFLRGSWSRGFLIPILWL